MKTFSILLLPVVLFNISILTAQKLNDQQLRTWWQKDLDLDSIPGIGLERTYKELIKERKGQEVVVAVLDTKIDILHEDFQGIFWVNKDEIPFNGIDDDHNGYVDDTNGWNFLGNHKNEDLSGQLVEPARIVQEWDSLFNNRDLESIPESQLKKFKTFKKAQKDLGKELDELNYRIRRADSLNAIYYEAVEIMNTKFNMSDYTQEIVDSLRGQHPEFESQLGLLSLGLQYDLTEQDFIDQQVYFKGALKSLDVNNRSRDMVGDNDRDILAVNYGNPILINNELDFQHSTGVTGLIAAKRKNTIGIKGFSDYIKIMPVVMVADGDENDKDVALGIRYAVDNGADIINMSWGKYLSSNHEWVVDAIKYASDNNVLLVSSSGNDSKNIDKEFNYPNDIFEQIEFTNSFIKVGSISQAYGTSFVSSFSNYGIDDVDIFAPGEDIYTTEAKSTYQTSSGTSYSSPLVAGTAALLKSYFPNLNAAEIKEMILASSTKIDLMVRRPGDDDDAPLVPFSSLSKTGGILNTYEAFKLAEEQSKN